MTICPFQSKKNYLKNYYIEGFDKTRYFICIQCQSKNKAAASRSVGIRGFYFCDKAEDGQNNGFTKPFTYSIV